MSTTPGKRWNQRDYAPWLFLAPGVLVFLLYVIFPIFQSIWISFYDWDGLGPKTGLGFKTMSICSMTNSSTHH